MEAKSKRLFTNIIWNRRLVIAAFLLPVFIITLAFISAGIYPFGDQQIAVIDFYHQYLPLIEELQYKLQHGESLFYTWNGMGGCNFWNIIAYQAASPLNILLIAVPAEYIMEGLTVLLIIRMGLAGSFMFIFLREYCGRAGAATVGFAVLYALNAYVMAYYWNVMWIDAVVLLPLCVMGLRRLVNGGGGTLFAVTLAVIVFSNYYIAIMVCIFVMTYYFAVYFEKKRDGGFRAFAGTSVKALAYSLMGLGMSAVMLIPTALSMRNSSAAESSFPESWFLYDDPLDILNQLLPFSKLCYLEGLPNIGCGMFIVMMVPFYYISRRICLREKIAATAYLVFLFFSLNVNVLDYIWHGFHYPNQLPYRYSFIVCFLLIGMAYKAFCDIDRSKIRHIWILLAAGLGYYLIASKIMAAVVDNKNTFFYYGIALLLIYCLLIVALKKDLLRKRTFGYCLVIVITAELICTAVTDIDIIGTTDRNTYNENASEIEKLVEYTEKDFARTEIDDALTLNEPARFHYKGMSQFASSMNSNTSELMERIGLEAAPGGNRSKYNLTSPVTNAMLNIKYIIAKNTEIEDEDLTLIKTEGNSRLYQNRYALSIGYMLPDSIRTWDYTSVNPFDNLNDYVRAATDNKCGDVFIPVEISDFGGSEAEVSRDGENYYRVTAGDPAVAGSALFNYKSGETQHYYLFVEASDAEQIIVKKQGESRDMEVDENYGSVIDIGEVEKGKGITVSVQFETGRSGTVDIYMCSMDRSEWDSAYGMISENMMEVTGSSSTGLTGTVDVSESGLFVTSIPYEEGWTLKVDGHTREIVDLTGGVWISAALDEGTHEIELSFRPPGFIAGLAVTILSVLAVIVATRRRELLRKLVSRREGSDCNTR